MAAKHDGKRASANAWVAQQNIAKWKGGRPHYQAPLRGPRVPKPVAASPEVPVTDASSTAETDPARPQD